MHSKNILQKLSICFLSVILVSCNKNGRSIEKIDFSTNYMFNSKIEEQVEKDTIRWKYQISASNYAAKGDYRNALIQWDSVTGVRDKEFTKVQVDSINSKYSKVNAKDYIIEQAKKNQVVIINEAHYNSFHRLFTKSLLVELYNNGYKNLGLEALSNGNSIDSTLKERGYPIQKSGFYIKDPQFGDLVRTALKIGYNVFPYEQATNSNGKQREIEQAKNIKKVIEANPDEKFLIHCGFDHVLEGNNKHWEKAMAGRLNEYTGINPFTINQVVYSERSKPEYNNPFLKALDIKESSVILDKDNKPFKYKRGDAWTDIAVFHPNTEYIDNRPSWLFQGENKNIPIELTDIEIAYPIMVLAYKKGEVINEAIPMDITEIERKNENCNLSLKKGVYEIVVANKTSAYRFEQRVE